MRHSPIAVRCDRCSDCDFRRRYRRLNSPAFAKCARSRESLRIANQSGWAILSDYFSKWWIAEIRWSLGTSLKCHIAAIGEKIIATHTMLIEGFRIAAYVCRSRFPFAMRLSSTIPWEGDEWGLGKIPS